MTEKAAWKAPEAHEADVHEPVRLGISPVLPESGTAYKERGPGLCQHDPLNTEGS
jgi:hypothetical protein